VTDLPYTDADLRHEAASQHRDLTRDHDFMGVGESMETAAILSSGKQWGASLDGPGFLTAHEAIDQYVRDAADTSEWAVNLGADGLEPDERQFEVNAGDKVIARVHFAFDPDMADDMRTALVTGLSDALAALL
jgi:hypothetical protein